MTLSGKNVDLSRVARLRVGIKWNPLERDDIGELLSIGSSENARQKLTSISKQSKQQRIISKLLKMAFAFHNKKGKTERYVSVDRKYQQNQTNKDILHKYLEQEKLKSFDLDLYCFCYDSKGKLFRFVSPVSTESKDVAHNEMAFIHSGDDETGTGERFDEEMLVNVDAIDKAVDEVYFVVHSVNHGFNEVKGGSWAILNTQGEKEVLFATLATKSIRKVCALAKMKRSAGGWSLKELTEYCLMDKDETIPLPKRIDEAIVSTLINPA